MPHRQPRATRHYPSLGRSDCRLLNTEQSGTLYGSGALRLQPGDVWSRTLGWTVCQLQSSSPTEPGQTGSHTSASDCVGTPSLVRIVYRHSASQAGQSVCVLVRAESDGIVCQTGSTIGQWSSVGQTRLFDMTCLLDRLVCWTWSSVGQDSSVGQGRLSDEVCL